MQYIKIGLLIVIGCSLFWLLVCLFRTRQVKSVITVSAISGVLALLVVCLIGKLGAETLHINPYTLGTASVLGIPGVILMVIINLVWAL